MCSVTDPAYLLCCSPLVLPANKMAQCVQCVQLLCDASRVILNILLTLLPHRVIALPLC